MRAGVVDGLVVNILHVFKVVLDRDDTLASELLDLLGTVLLPVGDVCVIADSHRPALEHVSKSWQKPEQWGEQNAYSEDDGSDVVVETGGANSLLVVLGGTGLISKDESSTNPDTGSTEHEGRGNALAVEDTAGSNNLDGLAGHGAGLALAELSHGRDKDAGRDVSGVATTLTTLGADDVDTNVETLLYMLGVADHVHIKDSSRVQSVNDMLWWHTDGRDEQLGAALDNNGDQLVKLSLGVVVARN